jgi:Anti-sigma factor NepR
MPGKHKAAGTRNMMNRESKPSQRMRATHAQKSEKNHVVKLGPDIKAKIGMQLRLMYGEVVDQGVPDRFVEMLKRLDDPNYEGK